MSEQVSNNTASNFRSEGQNPTQGQGEFDDPTTRDPNFAGPNIRSEDRGPTPGHGQFSDNLTTRASHSGNRAAGDPFQDTNQSADPDFGRDPARGQTNEQTRLPGTGGGQDTYPGGDREQRQAGNRDQVIGGPQERFEPPVNYGTSTGTGPGARPCDHDIRRDGGFGGKPSMPERMMGAAEKIVGKATGNVKMYQHGEDRKGGGY